MSVSRILGTCAGRDQVIQGACSQPDELLLVVLVHVTLHQTCVRPGTPRDLGNSPSGCFPQDAWDQAGMQALHGVDGTAVDHQRQLGVLQLDNLDWPHEGLG